MWFEKLSTEEIKRRLLKEGVFSPMLDSCGLLNEEKNECGDEQIDGEECIEVLKEGAKDILLPKLSGIPNSEGEDAKYTRFSRKLGDAVLELIADAKESIYITHFTPETYTAKYVAMFLEKVMAGLIVERIVYFHPNYYPKAYVWLDNFKENGVSRGKYKQFELKGPLLLPWDIMIVDKKYLVLWLHKKALFFEDVDMAESFLQLWKRLTPKDGMGKNKMELVVSYQ